MSDRTSGYAAAVVQIARTEGSLGTTLDELRQVARALEEHEELRDAIADSSRPVGQRLTLLESESLSAASPATRSALAALIAGGMGGELGDVATEVARSAAEERGRELAEVRVARELDEDQQERLRTALQEATGRQLVLEVVVDPSVVGGVRAVIGETVIDGSVARRLEDVRTRVGAA